MSDDKKPKKPSRQQVFTLLVLTVAAAEAAIAEARAEAATAAVDREQT